MVKKYVLILIIVLVAGILVSGCRKSIGDKVAEDMLEDMTEADVDISGDGKNVKIETEEGTYSAGDTVEWPADNMADIPEPDATLTALIDTVNGCSVAFAEMSKEDAEQYMQTLEDLGYGDGMTMADEDTLYYMGTNEDGATVNFTYDNDSQEGTITYIPLVEE